MAIADPTEGLFCGVPLTEATATSEHVLPRWLQDRYGLAELEPDQGF